MLNRDPMDLEHRSAWVLKEIETKFEKYLMLIFNSKTEILIKKLN
jgi:hypothetical protein